MHDNKSNDKLDTAVLLLIFNRPKETKLLFDAVRKSKPTRLYIASDGARKSVHGEEKRVLDARLIACDVDWPCVILTLFRKKNLGCKCAISSAISWFFEHEEFGIILD